MHKIMPLIISIEGNIGVGKSTFLDNLEESIRSTGTKKWVFLREPVHIWEEIRDPSGKSILATFYEDPIKYSFAFQVMAYSTRVQELRRILRENPDCYGVVCERSLDTDRRIFAKMLHADGSMEPMLYDIYKMFSSLNHDEFSLDGIIFLDATPKTCIDRIAKRSRNGESGISLAYLEQCHQYHKEWMTSIGSMRHITLNAMYTMDRAERDQELEKAVAFINHV